VGSGKYIRREELIVWVEEGEEGMGFGIFD